MVLTPTVCSNPHLLGRADPEMGGWSRNGRLAWREPPPSVRTPTFWAVRTQKWEVGVVLTPTVCTNPRLLGRADPEIGGWSRNGRLA